MSRRNSLSNKEQRRNSLNTPKISVNVDDAANVIADNVDLLFEKRKAVRESALMALHTTLSLRYCGETLELRQETLADGLERVIKDLQTEPTLLSLKILCLTSLSVQSGHQELYNKFFDLLIKLMVSEALDTSIRTEAVNTLSLLCFACSIFDTDHETTTSTNAVRILRDYVFSDRSVPPELFRAVLQGCMLIGGTMPTQAVHDLLYKEYLSKIIEIMGENNEINLRLSAAKTVTALVEWERERMKEEGLEEIEEDLEPVLDAMLALLGDKNKFKGKADLKKQKKNLKALIAFVEESEQMETETVMVRVTPVILKTWTQIFQMDKFRNIFGDGFMNHLEENRNIMHIFDYFVDTKMPIVQTMTKQERRLSQSEASRNATKARDQLRSIREHEVIGATD